MSPAPLISKKILPSTLLLASVIPELPSGEHPSIVKTVPSLLMSSLAFVVELTVFLICGVLLSVAFISEGTITGTRGVRFSTGFLLMYLTSSEKKCTGNYQNYV